MPRCFSPLATASTSYPEPDPLRATQTYRSISMHRPRRDLGSAWFSTGCPPHLCRCGPAWSPETPLRAERAHRAALCGPSHPRKVGHLHVNSTESKQARPSELPNLLTTEEAAAVLRVKTSWLERQAACRRIPFSMLGGCYRFTTEHLTQIVVIFEETPKNVPDEIPQPVHKSRPHSQPTAAAQSNVTPLRARPRRSSKSEYVAA